MLKGYSTDDVFLVTGSTSGIGKSLVLSLLNQGATVVAVGRSIEKLSALESESGASGKLVCEVRDLSNYMGLDKWMLGISKKYGKLKGLVLSAGIQQIVSFRSPLSIERSKELFDINYFSNMQLAKGFSDRRANIGEGSSIVFVSSIASIKGSPGLVGYAASKGAINSAVKSLAVEVSPLGVRVNAVLPGFVVTEMTKSWSNIYTEEFINHLDRTYPLGLGTVEDVVQPILFLLSDSAKWITGVGLVVDGGASVC